VGRAGTLFLTPRFPGGAVDPPEFFTMVVVAVDQRITILGTIISATANEIAGRSLGLFELGDMPLNRTFFHQSLSVSFTIIIIYGRD